MISDVVENACYGGYVGIDCASLKIQIQKEIYGRHPEEKCRPHESGRDCSTEGTFYKKLCNNKQKCQHLGVEWRNINTTKCPDVYTNYVHLVYKCVLDAGK